MGLISNGTTIFDAGALDSGLAKGAMTLIKTLTASSSATLSFINGSSGVVLDGTYKEYIFYFNNIHPSVNDALLQFNLTTDGTNFNVTKTTSFFLANHNEGDTAAAVAYFNTRDLAQSADDQRIMWEMQNDNDDAGVGTMQLFDPSNTTFVKHFMFRCNGVHVAVQKDQYCAGYCNVTAAIDGVQFKFSSGNIDAGTIKMYGIK